MTPEQERVAFEAAYVEQYPLSCQFAAGDKFAVDATGDYVDSFVGVGWAMWQKARAALAAAPVQAVPDGWKLVPAEPTIEMLDAARNAIDFDRAGQNTYYLEHPSHTEVHDKHGALVPGAVGGTTIKQDMEDAWAAMLAAAPAAPQVPAVQAESTGDLLFSTAAMQKRHAEYVGRVVSTLEDIKREHLGQQDLAEKSSRNARVQARYDELMQAGKHGHYETMFRVVREEVERVSGAPQPAERVPLTRAQVDACWDGLMPSGHGKSRYDIARAIEAAHGIRTAGVKEPAPRWLSDGELLQCIPLGVSILHSVAVRFGRSVLRAAGVKEQT